jgi:restriction system protein
MSIPKFESYMLPLMLAVRDGAVYRYKDLVVKMADHFGLGDEERSQLLPSGQQTILANRVGWAVLYLRKAGLLDYEKRSEIKITQRGLEILNAKPENVDVKFLAQFPEFQEFRKVRKKETQNNTKNFEELSPQDMIDKGYEHLRNELADELLGNIKKMDTFAFESLVVRLLVAMGYGGSIEDAGEALMRSRDEGIDGVIKEDRLGLDQIYIQAKRWEAVIGRPEIQKFAGSLQGQRARKGIFITTSRFSPDAIEYVKNIESKIVLINGKELAQLMIDFNIGVSRVGIYEVKRVDEEWWG